MTYSLKNITEKTDISAPALRFYEKEGLLTDIHRSKGGIRYYTDEDLEVLDLICCLKKTGMPLKEIKVFIELSRQGNQTLEERCDILRAQRDSIMDQIDELKQYLDKVTRKLNRFCAHLDEETKKQHLNQS